MESSTSKRRRHGAAVAAAPPASAETSAKTCAGLLGAAGLTLVLASILHSGVAVPLGATTFRDPFTGAAIPEAVLGVLCLLGAAAVLARWAPAYWLASVAAGLSILGTAYGLRVTVGGNRTGDIAYHLCLLALLLAAGLLLLRGDVRRLLTGAGRMTEPS
jgi:hypothetical protein